jgi:site-specific DNA-methyltransferase (adenine-specific)
MPNGRRHSLESLLRAGSFRYLFAANVGIYLQVHDTPKENADDAERRAPEPHPPRESIDLVITDPPYNTGMQASEHSRLGHFFNDALSPDAYRTLAVTVARELFRVLRIDRAAYVFINWKSLGVWLDAMSAAGFHAKNVIVWDKVIHGMTYRNYAYRHEFLIFAVKGRFFPANKRNEQAFFTDVWSIPRATVRTKASAVHATVKPLPLVELPILHASEPGDVVLDPFAGSGTTCVAAKALGTLSGWSATRCTSAARLNGSPKSISLRPAPQSTWHIAHQVSVLPAGSHAARKPRDEERARFLIRARPRSPPFIGEGYEVAQYQLAAAVFPDRAPNVVSRFVARALRHEFIHAERLQQIGMQRLRLTATGKRYLEQHGVASARLFVPRRSVALKDLAHTTWINDLRVTFGKLAPDQIAPAWLLQRLLGSGATAIPDLFISWSASGEREALTIACEVDLGGENLRHVFFPKLVLQQDAMRAWSDGSRFVILILTRGERRVAALRAWSEAEGGCFLVEELPRNFGKIGFEAVKNIIAAA